MIIPGTVRVFCSLGGGGKIQFHVDIVLKQGYSEGGDVVAEEVMSYKDATLSLF